MRSCVVFFLVAAGLAGAQDLPRWLKAGGELRGRGEGFTGLDYVPDNNDYYYLHRFRLNLGIEPLPWLKLFAQAQDSQAPGYRGPAPGTVVNTLDLHQGYLELGILDQMRWSVRAGRQEFLFGDARLVGNGAWGNVGRSFDAVRVSYKASGARVDAFVSSLAPTVNGRFDHPQTGNNFHGVYLSLENWIPRSTLEPYFLWKANSLGLAEDRRRGDLDVYTYGARWVGKAAARWDYGLEMAFQNGHSASDSLRAWAGHWNAGYSLGKDERVPRLVAEYNFASGDSNPRDGRQGTFDQLYPTNHAKYGIADRVGWRNTQDAMAGIDWKASGKLRVNVDYHSFWLNSVTDALYTDNGAAAVRNANATSRHVGQEIDLYAVYRYSNRLQFAAGVAHLFPGGFLKQSTRGAGVTSPYVMWTYTF